MDDGLGCFLTIVMMVTLIAFAIFVTITADKDRDKECKAVFGSEYVYINGDRSPSLCVSKTDGTIKYYDLIGR